MTSCLIGYTGFVGSTIGRQASFSHLFNSKNISDLGKSGSFEIAVCAAAPGSMFEANRFPDRDREKLNVLSQHLATIRTKRFILISSIAVLGDFSGGLDEATTNFQVDLAYGRHRRELEAFCQRTFENCLIVRLPALFGVGLKKNFLFDILNPVPSMLTPTRLHTLLAEIDTSMSSKVDGLYELDAATGMAVLDRKKLNSDPERKRLSAMICDLGFSATGFHNPATTYQYYDMMRLWPDITRAIDAGLRHIHLAPEPLNAARIYNRLLGTDMPDTGAKLHREDMHTRHADLWGKTGPYIESADDVLDRIASFYEKERDLT